MEQTCGLASMPNINLNSTYTNCEYGIDPSVLYEIDDPLLDEEVEHLYDEALQTDSKQTEQSECHITSNTNNSNTNNKHNHFKLLLN